MSINCNQCGTVSHNKMLPPVKLLQLISDNRITFLPIGQNQTYLKQLIKQAYSLLSSCRTLISETLSRCSSQLLRLMNQSFFHLPFIRLMQYFTYFPSIFLHFQWSAMFHISELIQSVYLSLITAKSLSSNPSFILLLICP